MKRCSACAWSAVPEEASAGAAAGKRTVRVEFDGGVNSRLPWSFHPEQLTMDVVPGELNEALYFARNDSAAAVVGSAVPSVAPARASGFFSKTECFCFTAQTLQAGEKRDMPVRFIVDPTCRRRSRRSPCPTPSTATTRCPIGWPRPPPRTARTPHPDPDTDMAQTPTDANVYFVPAQSKWPFVGSIAMMVTMVGVASWLNDAGWGAGRSTSASRCWC